MLGDLSETLGDFWEDFGRLLGSGTETDKEADRKTIRETGRGDRQGDRLGDRRVDRQVGRQGDFRRFWGWETQEQTKSSRNHKPIYIVFVCQTPDRSAFAGKYVN